MRPADRTVPQCRRLNCQAARARRLGPVNYPRPTTEAGRGRRMKIGKTREAEAPSSIRHLLEPGMLSTLLKLSRLVGPRRPLPSTNWTGLQHGHPPGAHEEEVPVVETTVMEPEWLLPGPTGLLPPFPPPGWGSLSKRPPEGLPALMDLQIPKPAWLNEKPDRRRRRRRGRKVRMEEAGEGPQDPTLLPGPRTPPPPPGPIDLRTKLNQRRKEREEKGERDVIPLFLTLPPPQTEPLALVVEGQVKQVPQVGQVEKVRQDKPENPIPASEGPLVSPGQVTSLLAPEDLPPLPTEPQTEAMPVPGPEPPSPDMVRPCQTPPAERIEGLEERIERMRRERSIPRFCRGTSESSDESLLATPSPPAMESEALDLTTSPSAEASDPVTESPFLNAAAQTRPVTLPQVPTPTPQPGGGTEASREGEEMQVDDISSREAIPDPQGSSYLFDEEMAAIFPQEGETDFPPENEGEDSPREFTGEEVRELLG